jgi:uncharacterized protein (TIGR04255 family)
MADTVSSTTFLTMSDYPHLSRAPIVEAVLDIRAVLPPGTDVESLKAVSPGFRERYPRERTLRGVAAKVSVSDAEARIDEVPAWVRGFMFHSRDDLYRVQFRQDGFTLNRLKPYTDWSEVIDRARDGWEEYLRVAQPGAVSRVAVRYINRFELGLPVELSDYLVSAPELPPPVPQGLSSFLWRWVVKDEETGMSFNLTQASEPVTEAQTVGVIVDIDCYIMESVQPRDERIFEWLAQLRVLKNRIFFGTLTPRALEMFK